MKISVLICFVLKEHGPLTQKQIGKLVNNLRAKPHLYGISHGYFTPNQQHFTKISVLAAGYIKIVGMQDVSYTYGLTPRGELFLAGAQKDVKHEKDNSPRDGSGSERKRLGNRGSTHPKNSEKVQRHSRARPEAWY